MFLKADKAHKDETKKIDRQMIDRQIDRWIDSQTDRETDR